MIRPELDLIAATIRQALQEARLSAGDVDRILLTGGSAYIPAFRDDLAQAFGSERLEQRDAFTAVVHGGPGEGRLRQNCGITELDTLLAW